jgi:hypothetical protein
MFKLAKPAGRRGVSRLADVREACSFREYPRKTMKNRYLRGATNFAVKSDSMTRIYQRPLATVAKEAKTNARQNQDINFTSGAASRLG